MEVKTEIKTCIVITTINRPTIAVERFAQVENTNLIVVGDMKTPEDWFMPGVDFLSVRVQASLGYEVAKDLPFNHYCRKMLGYLYAVKLGADVIVDTDDDNIPYPHWEIPPFEDDFEVITGNGFFNVYKKFTSKNVWPRGFPLRYIRVQSNLIEHKSATSSVGVWQGLADEDPDVDAIYRLVDNDPCFFERRPPLVLAPGLVCPFNSQNTAFRKELFPLLYLPCHVSFRFTDILRGIVAQPIMWAHGYTLGFTEATVIQKRNPHDYFKDFLSELPMFQHTERAFDLAVKTVNSGKSISTNLYDVYNLLRKEGVVMEKELEVLQAWLTDINKS